MSDGCADCPEPGITETPVENIEQARATTTMEETATRVGSLLVLSAENIRNQYANLLVEGKRIVEVCDVSAEAYPELAERFQRERAAGEVLVHLFNQIEGVLRELPGVQTVVIR